MAGRSAAGWRREAYDKPFRRISMKKTERQRKRELRRKKRLAKKKAKRMRKREKKWEKKSLRFFKLAQLVMGGLLLWKKD